MRTTAPECHWLIKITPKKDCTTPQQNLLCFHRPNKSDLNSPSVQLTPQSKKWWPFFTSPTTGKGRKQQRKQGAEMVLYHSAGNRSKLDKWYFTRGPALIKTCCGYQGSQGSRIISDLRLKRCFKSPLPPVATRRRALKNNFRIQICACSPISSPVELVWRRSRACYWQTAASTEQQWTAAGFCQCVFKWSLLDWKSSTPQKSYSKKVIWVSRLFHGPILCTFESISQTDEKERKPLRKERTTVVVMWLLTPICTDHRSGSSGSIHF